tara:strand:+ start:2034 stop:2276 length:243 start_codon:yes stop_codon:yes gene_type:complete
MSKDYVWNNEILADIVMTLAAATGSDPCLDALSDDTLKEFADELRKYDSLVTDLANELEKALNENEMLKGRILDLAGRVK